MVIVKDQSSHLVYLNMHKITNLWKFELISSSKLRDNNERKNTLVAPWSHPTKLCAFRCLISMQCSWLTVKNTGCQFWWFWSSVGSTCILFKPQSLHLCPLKARHLTMMLCLRMKCKAFGPVCCLRHEEEPQCTYRKEKGFAPVFLVSLAALLRRSTL